MPVRHFTAFATIYWLVSIFFFLVRSHDFLAVFPELFGPIVLISNQKIPINYGNIPKNHGN